MYLRLGFAYTQLMQTRDNRLKTSREEIFFRWMNEKYKSNEILHNHERQWHSSAFIICQGRMQMALTAVWIYYVSFWFFGGFNALAHFLTMRINNFHWMILTSFKKLWELVLINRVLRSVKWYLIFSSWIPVLQKISVVHIADQTDKFQRF